jgi:hypothetical protein
MSISFFFVFSNSITGSVLLLMMQLRSVKLQFVIIFYLFSIINLKIVCCWILPMILFCGIFMASARGVMENSYVGTPSASGCSITYMAYWKLLRTAFVYSFCQILFKSIDGIRGWLGESLILDFGLVFVFPRMTRNIRLLRIFDLEFDRDTHCSWIFSF